MTMPDRLLMASLVVAGAAACGAATPAADVAPLVTDSLGIEIVTSRHPLALDTAGWSLSPTPMMELSTHPTDPDLVMHWIRDGTRLSDGRVVIVSASAKRLLLFSPQGELLSGYVVARTFKSGTVPVGARTRWPEGLVVLGPDSTARFLGEFSGSELFAESERNSRWAFFANRTFVALRATPPAMTASPPSPS